MVGVATGTVPITDAHVRGQYGILRAITSYDPYSVVHLIIVAQFQEEIGESLSCVWWMEKVEVDYANKYYDNNYYRYYICI